MSNETFGGHWYEINGIPCSEAVYEEIMGLVFEKVQAEDDVNHLRKTCVAQEKEICRLKASLSVFATGELDLLRYLAIQYPGGEDYVRARNAWLNKKYRGA